MTRHKTIAVRLALAALSVCLVMTALSRQPMAAELLMLEDRGCPWCERWRREIGVAYPKTTEGRRAPLRTIERSRAPESGIAFAVPVVVSPTFVLVEEGREVGRITGYPGSDFFWGMLGELLERLERLERKSSVGPKIAAQSQATWERATERPAVPP